jgi:3-methyladenine DNA glycosylase AlkD
MNNYYFEDIKRYIKSLKEQSFEGWSEEEVKGYLTACESINQKVDKVQMSARLDSMSEDF